MRPIDRRTYLKAVGATGAIGLTATAGCTGGGGGGDGGTTTVTPGTAPGFPPFEMKQGGELVGFDIDLLSAVVENAEGYQLGEWQEFEFKALIPALTNDKIDVIAAAMTITDERDQTVDFSDPYYNADQAILVREGGDFSPNSLSDLAGHTLGAQKGTTGESVIQEQLIKTGKVSEQNYNSYGNYVLAVEDLQNGNIDAVVLDTPVANTFAGDRPVKVAFVYQTGERYGFAVREESNQLIGALNDGLEAVMASDRYNQITKKWFGQQ
ncbi:MAG: basic amino acid ABC transporter substrate-binding protein [Halodesulfurarchaeum sp.]